MVTRDLVVYIKDELREGKDPSTVESMLLNTGWGEQDIKGAMDQACYQLKLEKPAASAAKPSQKSSPSGDPRMYPIIAIPLLESPNRLWAIPIFGGLLKIVILLPVFCLLFVVALSASVVTSLINPFVVLVTGKYFQLAYDLFVFVMRLNTKTLFFMYGLTDTYPGFNAHLPDKFIVDIALPEHPNKLFAIPLVGLIARTLLLFPFSVFAYVIQLGAGFGVLIASFPVLVFRKYPESIYELVIDQTRLSLAMSAYGSGISDTYPNFSISWDHKKIKIALIVVGVILVIFSYSLKFIQLFFPDQARPIVSVPSQVPFPNVSPSGISKVTIIPRTLVK